MTDDDLRVVVRDFVGSVSEALADNNRRMDDFRAEMRERQRTSDTAILNEIADLGKKMERQFGRIDSRLTGVEGRLNANGNGA